NDIHKVVFRLPKDAYYALKHCRMVNGTVQTTLGILWYKLLNELKKHGITQFTDQPKFEDFIVGLQLVGGGATEVADAEPPCVDDGGGATAASPSVESTPGKQLRSKSRPAKRSGGGRRRKE